MTYNYFPELSNWMFITVLAGTMFSTVLSSLLEWSNMNKKNLKENLSDLFKENVLAKKLFSKAKIEKAEKYSSECEIFSDKVSSIQGGISSFAILIGIVPFIFDSLLSMGFNTYLTYSMCIVGYTILTTIFGIPFSLYETFGIEQKYGFNKTTKSLFWIDTVKSVLIGSVISIVLACTLNYILRSIGTFTIEKTLILISVLAVLGLVMEFISFLIMRMFNKFTPLKDKRLLKSLEKILKGSKDEYLLKRVFVMDGSKRSTHSNAFVMGFWKFKRIVLFDTLLKKYTPEEITAILAHELSHSRKGHLTIHRITGFLELSVSVFLLTMFISNINLYHAFGFSFVTPENLKEFPLLGFALASTVLSSIKTILLLDPLESFVSRKMEYAADRGAVLLMKKKKPLQTALLKLTSENLSDLFPSKYYEAFEYDHPSILNRLRNISKTKITKNNNKSK